MHVKNVVEACLKHGDMILRYLLIFSFQPPLNSCGLSQKNVQRYQVESQARACYVTQFTYKS